MSRAANRLVDDRRVTDLQLALGRQRLQELLMQFQREIATVASVPDTVLDLILHRIRGTASSLGLVEVAETLLACQQQLAADGSVDPALKARLESQMAAARSHIARVNTVGIADSACQLDSVLTPFKTQEQRSCNPRLSW